MLIKKSVIPVRIDVDFGWQRLDLSSPTVYIPEMVQHFYGNLCRTVYSICPGVEILPAYGWGRTEDDYPKAYAVANSKEEFKKYKHLLKEHLGYPMSWWSDDIWRVSYGGGSYANHYTIELHLVSREDVPKDFYEDQA